jgi:hypothetical protein
MSEMAGEVKDIDGAKLSRSAIDIESLLGAAREAERARIREGAVERVLGLDWDFNREFAARIVDAVLGKEGV